MLEITWVSATLTTEVGITKSIGETRGTYHLQALHRKTVRCFCYYHLKLRLNTQFKMKHKKCPNVRACPVPAQRCPVGKVLLLQIGFSGDPRLPVLLHWAAKEVLKLC